ncbi:RagB/SusD family nutrient uptake outer membrane protein [Olivibacter sp. SDN3]|uniref:RagB/SusD family nutrient uptake outer membrane protein n=1 Tax=Olivibacter sp. SDN3 TaxID=2764720 RepID=UPI0016513740|nr:RagB/SusD family nutrient uptake outer membrane protein [Olivibacter sp. SDN3]QNL51913.1 RagB/SusD family nutrient uptake outer membrane protein [Olivibacter sp. SDN3]
MKNKALHINLGFIIMLFTINACTNKFLDESPKDFLSPTNYYRTSSDAEAAIISVYAGLMSIYSQNMYFLADLPSEQTNFGTGTNVDRINIDNFQFEAENQIVMNIWNHSYRNINRANAVIDRVPDIDMDAQRAGVIVAEARFLRALNYFNLVRLFGGVPLRLQETASLADLGIPRSSAEEVYELIISDLVEAEAILPNTVSGGKASKGAASTLLAYVYLTRSDWSNAATKAQEVADNAASFGYSLFEEYSDIWKIENENTREHIFSCQYQSGPEGLGSAYSHFFMSRQANAILKGGSGYSAHMVEDAFWQSFETSDKRRDASILSSFIDPNNQQVVSYPSGGLTELSIFKYYDPEPFARNNNNNNYPILRYADVLLILAEALNELEGPNDRAYRAMNEIRRRAGLDVLEHLSQQQFRDAILQERSWEFCFESKRFFDLIRTETLIPIMQAAGKNPGPENLLYPIPQREIDVNDQINAADQNPGY